MVNQFGGSLGTGGGAGGSTNPITLTFLLNGAIPFTLISNTTGNYHISIRKVAGLGPSLMMDVSRADATVQMTVQNASANTVLGTTLGIRWPIGSASLQVEKGGAAMCNGLYRAVIIAN